jgi:HK97 family phage major capsid protein
LPSSRSAFGTMDSDVTAAAADYLVIYGDIRQAYTIVDRVGSTILPNGLLVGANRRPTGQVGWLLWRRFGAGLTNASAARLLNKSA